MIVNYHLFGFTGIVDIEAQVYVANSVIVIVMGNVAVNFGLIIKDLISRFIAYLKLKYAIRAWRKQNKI